MTQTICNLREVVFKLPKRQVTVTAYEGGVWIEVDGYSPRNFNEKQSIRTVSVDKAVLFIDMLYEPETTVKIWSNPEIEEYTHNIKLKEK